MELADWFDIPGHSQKAMAERVRVTPGAISHYVTRRRLVPAELVLPIARETGFVVRPHDLRPDLYPNEKDAVPINGSCQLGHGHEVSAALPRAAIAYSAEKTEEIG